jgi:hypothetical protein
MAIVDAQKDFTQSPNPDYVLDANSVLRFPKKGPVGVIIIGDSILTGWSGYFAHVFPNALIDGRVGRQFYSAIPIWKTLQQTQLTHGVGDVVIELGTNGEVFPDDMDAFLKLVGNRQVFLVMPEMPRSWEQEVQQLIYRLLPRTLMCTWYAGICSAKIIPLIFGRIWCILIGRAFR